MFVFDTKLSAGNADIITDFKHGIDKIVLATSIFGKLGPSVEAVELVIGNGSKPLAAKQADDHLLYNKKTGQLFYDDDGKGKHAAVLVATFDKLPGGGLDHTDFLIV
jgi:Ca2+-binding RTX toxin-like protein